VVESIGCLRHRLEMEVDPLADILTLAGARYVRVRVPEGWRVLGAQIPATAEDQADRNREGRMLASRRW
jgi:hypothetical protein